MPADVHERHFVGPGLASDQRSGASVHLHGTYLDADGRIHARLWIHVFQNVARSLHFHRRQTQQEGGSVLFESFDPRAGSSSGS